MPVDPVPPPTGRPIVFYVPHQDDETLFMGQVIAHHALAGREVHLVLCTSGATSAVFDALTGVDHNGWWGGWHFPAREGYVPLTRREFGEARTREFAAAAGQLGVPPAQLHTEALPARVDLPDAVTLIRSYAELFLARGEPQVGHYTMWWDDPHPDHAHLGQALRQLCARHPVRFEDSRWLVKPEQAAAAGAGRYQLPPALRSEVLRMTRRAVLAYRSWAPAAGMFAIGYHSVGLAYFDDVERGDPNHLLRLD